MFPAWRYGSEGRPLASNTGVTGWAAYYQAVPNRPFSYVRVSGADWVSKNPFSTFRIAYKSDIHFEHMEDPVIAHTFSYTRVSTASQTTDNQIIEIEAAGHQIDASYADVVSGKVPAMERPEFAKLMDAIERTRKPKRLVVTKLDRLGRDVEDVLGMIRRLENVGCSLRVLQFGDLDLISPAGRLVMTTLAAVARMERDLLIERTHAGLDRARREGKRLGRPCALSDSQKQAVLERIISGETISAIARDYGVSRATILRVKDTA